MRIRRADLSLGAWLLLAVCAAGAQEPRESPAIPDSENAAVGYNAAFAMLKIPEHDEPDLWNLSTHYFYHGEPEGIDELAPLIESNTPAIQAMQASSKLDACSFGPPAEGFPPPIPPRYRSSRALVRLNLVFGLWLESHDRLGEAAECWLCGLRFGEHFSREGPFFAAVLAQHFQTRNLTPLLRIVGGANPPERILDAIDTVCRRLPAYGINFSNSIRSEIRFGRVRAWETAARSDDPERALAEFAKGTLSTPTEIINDALGKSPVDALAILRQRCSKIGLAVEDLQDKAKVRRFLSGMAETDRELTSAVAACFEEPFLQAKHELEVLSGRDMNPILRQNFEAFVSYNDARTEVEVKRAGLLALIALLRHRRAHGNDAASLDGMDLPPNPDTGRFFEVSRDSDGIRLSCDRKDSSDGPIVLRLKLP